MPTKSYDTVYTFEKEVAKFSGSKYGVAVASCSDALFLSCVYLRVKQVTLPNRTYFSVPCSVIHAGGKVRFEKESWKGYYQLKPYPIYDSALRFKKDMYIKGSFYCISFHAKKSLNIGRGGMILCDDLRAVKWFRKARFDGRSDIVMKDDKIDMLGWNMYMIPEQAARGLHLLELIKERPQKDIVNDYPDLSKFKIYDTLSPSM